MTTIYDHIGENPNIDIKRKTCIYCKENKPLNEFGGHSHHKDGYDSRCNACKRKQNNLRKDLKKRHPKKSDICDCCKTYNSKLVLDHDHQTKKFRGWICEPCNLGIGKLGDSISSLLKAIIYLIKCKLRLKE